MIPLVPPTAAAVWEVVVELEITAPLVTSNDMMHPVVPLGHDIGVPVTWLACTLRKIQSWISFTTAPLEWAAALVPSCARETFRVPLPTLVIFMISESIWMKSFAAKPVVEATLAAVALLLMLALSVVEATVPRNSVTGEHLVAPPAK